MFGWYKYFRWLSLDIVLGAIFFVFYLGKFYNVRIHLSVFIALATAVWLIYTIDHLIDAAKVIRPSSGRHRFHKSNSHALTITSGFVSVLGLVNLYFLPIEVIRNGALLASVCAAYLLLIYWFKRLCVKEVIVSLGYGLGIFLAPVSLKGSLEVLDVILLFQLVLIAFLNLMIFSYFDQVKDQRDGFGSLVIRLGTAGAKLLIHVVSFSVLGSSMVALVVTHNEIFGLFGLMAAVLYVLFLAPFFSLNERFRIVGDAIFYLPLLFLL